MAIMTQRQPHNSAEQIIDESAPAKRPTCPPGVKLLALMFTPVSVEEKPTTDVVEDPTPGQSTVKAPPCARQDGATRMGTSSKAAIVAALFDAQPPTAPYVVGVIW